MVSQARSASARAVLAVLKYSTRFLLYRWRPTIIGVTGSAGKSTFVSLLASTLSAEFSVFHTKVGNSETGIPLELLGLRWLIREHGVLHWIPIVLLAPIMAAFAPRKESVLIIEMAIDSPHPPKNMEYLLEFISPSIGIVLNVAPAHTEQFSRLFSHTPTAEELKTAIAQEKGKLLTSLQSNQQAILNLDQPELRALVSQIKANITSFGTSSGANFRVIESEVGLDHSRFVVQETSTNKSFSIEFPRVLVPSLLGGSVAACLAVGVVMGIPPARLSKRLNGLSEKELLRISPPGRASVFEGKRGSTIIDSSYNSSPVTIAEFLRIFSTITPKRGGRKMLVLGDMRELGPLTTEAHQVVAELVKKTKPDQVFLVGEVMKKVVLPALEQAGLLVEWYASSQLLGKRLARVVNKHDLLMVKGSQNTIFLEEAVKQVLKYPSRDLERLCRQTPDWLHQKEEFFQSIATPQSKRASR